VRLILVRHGQSEGNARGVVQGHLDYGLTELGVRQAELTARVLATEKVDRVLSSPLLRAKATANRIATVHGVEVVEELALREYHIGEIAGMTGAQIREQHPELAAAWGRDERPAFPGEEGREVFFERLSGLLDGFTTTSDTVVAVAHGGVIAALCYAVLGLDYYSKPGVFRVSNCSITEVVRERNGRLVLKRHNETCHLGELMTSVDVG
jgi:broad specificity phosphatase PhoE